MDRNKRDEQLDDTQIRRDTQVSGRSEESDQSSSDLADDDRMSER